jgi:hypothetical protein
MFRLVEYRGGNKDIKSSIIIAFCQPHNAHYTKYMYSTGTGTSGMLLQR